jgi:tetratricopeptide (TPR) repeat protein
MAINKRKVLEAARKHVQKGARAKAFKEYGKLLAADPQDAKLLLEVGDTYRRWGEVEEAISHYTKVASLHRGEGYDARAIAVLKQIINLDPMRHTVRVVLAELYQQIGLAAEAVSALQQVADVYAKEGRQRESLDLLRKMAAVDPRNVKARIKVAELLEKAGHGPEAVEEFREAAAEFSRLGESRSVVEMHERILTLAPHHVPTLVAIAGELVKLGEGERAEPYALRALEAEVKAEHYELAREIYSQTGDADRLAEMTRGLASFYRERGDDELARDVLQRAPMGTELDAGEFGADAEDDPVVVDEVAPAEPEDPGHDSQPDEPERSLEQADVHLGYGQYSEAIAYLENYIMESPRHIQALEKLGDAHVGSGDDTAASQAWEKAEAIAREEGDEESAARLRSRLEVLAGIETTGDSPLEFGEEFEIEIDSNTDAEAGDAFTVDAGDSGDTESFDVGTGIDGKIAEDAVDPTDDAEEVEIDLEGAFDEDFEPGGDSGDAQPIPLVESDSDRIDEDLEEAEFYLQQSMVAEAGAIYRRILESVPDHPAALAKLAEIESSETLSVPEQGGPLGESSDLDFDLDSDSDTDLETDFEADLDLDFDIGTESRDTAVGFGSVPGVEADGTDSETEIEIEIDDLSDEENDRVSSKESDIDLDEISLAPGTEAATVDEGVAELFADFKQGVSETLEKGDFQTRFDLGIAYREMELLEDAIAEFRYCLESSDWRLQSLQMIGLSSLDLGRAADAVSHFEQALSAPDLSDAQKSGLYFDFGRAQAALGDTDPAHDSFARVRAIDPNFFGLEEAVASLPPRTPGTEPVEEQYESFDDLMAEFNDDESGNSKK